MAGMRRFDPKHVRALLLLLVVVALACDPAPRAQAPPSAVAQASPAPPDLPAAEPALPAVEAFAAQAAMACASAAQAIALVPLDGDPLAAQAGRADVRAAVRHFRAVAASWTQAAEDLFAFGLPEDKRGQELVAALDILALRATQLADALGGGDKQAAQAAAAGYDQAFAEADWRGRNLGLRPLGVCARPQPGRGPRQRVRLIATDFAFSAPALSAGRARIIVRNRGHEAHQLFVVPLRRAGTLTQAVEADRRGDRPGRYLAGAGATSAVLYPGERDVMDVRLEAGPYALLCFVPSQDGTPHAYKGMAREIFVQAR